MNHNSIKCNILYKLCSFYIEERISKGKKVENSQTFVFSSLSSHFFFRELIQSYGFLKMDYDRNSSKL